MTDDKVSMEEHKKTVLKLKEIEKLKKKLDKYHNQLEELVRERTSELEDANKLLQNEVATRKAAENELWRLNVEINQIFNVSIPICLIDQNFNLVQVNDSFCSFFNIPETEVYQKKCYEIRRGPHCHMETCTLKRIAKDRKIVSYEHEFLNSENQKEHYVIIARPYLSPDGEFLGIIENFIDITKLVQANKEKDRLFKAIEISQEAISLQDSDLRLIYTNNAMNTLFGYDKGELIGKHVSIINAGSLEDQEKMVKKIIYSLNDTGVWEGEIRNIRKDGTKFTSSAKISVLFDQNGHIINYISTQHNITERKRAEEELRYQAMLLDNVSDAIISTDANLTIRSWNNAAERIYGWNATEVIGKPIANLLQAEYPDTTQEEVRRQLLSEVGWWEGEAIHRRKDGTKVYIHASASLIKDTAGKMVGAVTIVRDITARKQAEHRIKTSELALKERVKELTCLYGLSQLIESRTITTDALFKGVLKLIPPAMQFSRIARIRIVYGDEHFESPDFKETQWKFSTKKSIAGGILEIYVYYLEDKPFHKEEHDLLHDVVKRLGNFINQKLGADLLLESETRYRQIFEESPIALKEEDLSEVKIFIESLKNRGITNLRTYFDQNHEELQKCAMLVKTLNANKVYMRLYHADTIDELGLEKILTDASYKTFQDELLMLVEGKTSYEAEVITQTLQGDEVYIYMLMSVVPRHEDDLSRVLVSVVDVTERVKFDNLRKAFASTVSHEFRTPISVINQSIKNLKNYKEKLSEAQYNRLMESLERNAGLLAEYVEDLLLISRYDEEFGKFEPTAYHPLEILHSVLSQLQPRLEEKKITTVYQIDFKIQLIGDSSKIDQLFRIFLDNAIKYSDEESEISITALDHYQGEFNPKGVDGALIKFTDHGMGIREDDIPYVFERFYRSQEVNTVPGTGLGLYIAREIASLHKGSIHIESIPGKGSTFYLFLPRLESS